jgi:hypothetical protein
MPPQSLEHELQQRAKNGGDAEDFHHRYEAMKSYLKREYYPWIQANCPFFTDHGEQHIRSVIRAASNMLEPNLSNRRAKSGDQSGDLSDLDIFLLLAGILWHDVGNVYGRTDHAKRIAEMTDEIKKLGFPTPAVHRLVNEISTAHAGQSGLSGPKREEDCATVNRTYTVYPRALAAIVRFADEVSEDRTRISSALLDSIPEKNQVYWQYAHCVAASRPDPTRKRVVLTIELDKSKAKQKYSCTDFGHRSKDGRISLIEYVVSRLEKMNNERAYCAAKFSRYMDVDELTCRFAMFADGARLGDGELDFGVGDYGMNREGYPSIPLFDQFFETNPTFKPENL